MPQWGHLARGHINRFKCLKGFYDVYKDVKGEGRGESMNVEEIKKSLDFKVIEFLNLRLITIDGHQNSLLTTRSVPHLI